MRVREAGRRRQRRIGGATRFVPAAALASSPLLFWLLLSSSKPTAPAAGAFSVRRTVRIGIRISFVMLATILSSSWSMNPLAALLIGDKHNFVSVSAFSVSRRMRDRSTCSTIQIRSPRIRIRQQQSTEQEFPAKTTLTRRSSVHGAEDTACAGGRVVVAEEEDSTINTNSPVDKETEQDGGATKGKSKTIFASLAHHVADTILSSDAKRDTGFDGASTGWTSWIDEGAAAELQTCIDRIRLRNDDTNLVIPVPGDGDSDDLLQYQQQQQCMSWIQSCPAPLQVELSPHLRSAVAATERFQSHLQQQSVSGVSAAAEATSDADVDNGDPSSSSSWKSDEKGHSRQPEDGASSLVEAELLLQRLGLRLIHLPSGGTLPQPLRTAPGAMVYGILLRNGVTRFRLIGSRQPKRRAGERTAILPVASTAPANEKRLDTAASSSNSMEPSWLQYGGPERNYQAVDMGPCLLMEIILLPFGLTLPLLRQEESAGDDYSNMVVSSSSVMSALRPDLFLCSAQELSAKQVARAATSETTTATANTRPASSLNVCDLESNFCRTVGGLQSQIDEIVRRVLDGRVVRPASIGTENAVSHELDRIRRQEMEALLELGLQPCRGLLLHGPPGGGKTLLAREISTILDARPPKIVAAPELLDRWVGGTERLVRELFADAEYELHQLCGGDATKSALHVIVIDEIDAVFRKRSAGDGTSEVTRASAVNQILAKLDGVKSLGNVLVIGMTNRRELLDEALLRPGRLEVQIEIPLPDRKGRREILQIQFGALRRRGRLSQPLCRAIDGNTAGVSSSSAAMDESAFKGVGRLVRLFGRRTGDTLQLRDLASNRWTGGFSGADIAGLVRCAGSIALARSRSQGDGGVGSLLITLDDVARALKEVKQ